jgi:hypothetical protein
LQSLSFINTINTIFCRLNKNTHEKNIIITGTSEESDCSWLQFAKEGHKCISYFKRTIPDGYNQYEYKCTICRLSLESDLQKNYKIANSDNKKEKM